MITVYENEQARPVCPHCENEIADIWAQRIKTFLGKRYLYFCPKCRKVLGISHRKGCFTQ